MHAGTVVALGPDGSTALALGTPDEPVFPRSSNKPLQAVGMLRAGWRPADEAQLTLACASHSGEDAHLDVVRQMLATRSEQALGCPPALPLDEAAAAALLAAGGGPTRLHMNCSGKHAAMLATCADAGWAERGYLDTAHPLQVALQAAVEDLAGEHVRHVAVDGCGAPQHALTPRGLARAFARLAIAGASTDEGRVADAVRHRPELLGGTRRDVTDLLRMLPGSIAKDGAEGVYALALPDGSAVVLKIADGASRARIPVLVAALRALGTTAPELDALAQVPVLGGGEVVGVVRAVLP